MSFIQNIDFLYSARKSVKGTPNEQLVEPLLAVIDDLKTAGISPSDPDVQELFDDELRSQISEVAKRVKNSKPKDRTKQKAAKKSRTAVVRANRSRKASNAKRAAAAQDRAKQRAIIKALAEDFERKSAPKTTKETQPKEKPAPKAKPTTKADAAKAKKAAELTADDKDLVRAKSPEQVFIARYLKEVRQGDKNSVTLALQGIQRAELSGKIKETGKFAEEMRFIANQYKKVLEGRAPYRPQPDDKTLQHMVAVSKSEKIFPTVAYVSKYIGKIGKPLTKKTMQNMREEGVMILSQVKPSEPMYDKVKTIVSKLDNTRPVFDLVEPVKIGLTGRRRRKKARARR